MKNYVLRRDHKGSVGSIFITVVFMMGALAAMAIIGGVIAIVLNVFSPTEIDFWGVKITTGHVGVSPPVNTGPVYADEEQNPHL